MSAKSLLQDVGRTEARDYPSKISLLRKLSNGLDLGHSRYAAVLARVPLRLTSATEPQLDQVDHDAS